MGVLHLKDANWYAPFVTANKIAKEKELIVDVIVRDEKARGQIMLRIPRSNLIILMRFGVRTVWC